MNCPKCPIFSTLETCATMWHLILFKIKFKTGLLMKRDCSLLKTAFAMAILDVIPSAHFASLATTPHKYLKYSQFSSFFLYIKIRTADVCLGNVISLVCFSRWYVSVKQSSNFQSIHPFVYTSRNVATSISYCRISVKWNSKLINFSVIFNIACYDYTAFVIQRSMMG